MLRLFAYKKIIIFLFAFLAVISIFLLGSLKFSFDFSQFFPEGDDDLLFYQEFIKDFGTDDNFLLVAIENDSTVFNQDFLKRFHQFSLAAKKLPKVKNAVSLTTLSYPLKTSFGYTKLPIIHLDEPKRYEEDWEKIKKSELYLNSLISNDAKSLVVTLITEDELNYKESVHLLEAVDLQLNKNELVNAHIIGRASFYQAIVNMEKREFIITSLAAFLLITIMLFVVYRDIRITLISLGSVVVGILIFLGILSISGNELNLIALFYPLLLVIVGTSDVIHIMDGYLREIKKGITKQQAITITLKGVGVSTLLTSLTTAAGFASLLFSKLKFIRDFGLNSAIIGGNDHVHNSNICLPTACSSYLTLKIAVRKLINPEYADRYLKRVNTFTKKSPRLILLASLIVLIVLCYGVSLINTNYQFRSSLPQGTKIAEDFDFFQNKYSGFRPIEVAVITKDEALITDYVIVKEIERVSHEMLNSQYIRSVQSVNVLYKTLNKAHNLNKDEFYRLPNDEKEFEFQKKSSQKFIGRGLNTFVSSSLKKGEDDRQSA